MSISTFATWLDAVAQCVEKRLDTLLSPANGQPKLLEAMRYATLNGGKRLRPAMVYAISGETPEGPSLSLEAACALELIHCYSLVHDDLPCMDDDDTRRNRPACHIVYGTAMALLVGDCLQSLAFETLAKSGLPATACGVLAHCIGFQGMGGGQALDIEQNSSIDHHTLDQLGKLKTGCLFDGACQLALLCNPTDNAQQQQLLAQFGYSFGRFFQIANDIQGQEKDTALGKITYATHPQYDAASEASTQQRQLLTLLSNNFPRLNDMTLATYTP